MEKKIKILYINSSAAIFGSERRLIDILDYLDKEKFEVMVLLPCEGPLLNLLKEKGVKVVISDFQFKVLFKNIYRFFKLNSNFLRILKENKIDLVHINLHYFTSNFWLALLLNPTPVIVHLRLSDWISIFEKFVFSRFSRIICVSEFIKNRFLLKRRSDFMTKLDKKKVMVIHNGINIEKFNCNDVDFSFKDEIGIAHETRIIGMVGALDEIKGQDILIHAARKICDIYTDTKFIIVGDIYGPYLRKKHKIAYKDNLSLLIKQMNLEGNVFILGFRNDVARIMSSFNILVQPSLREAFGGSMIEAMACGKPVIGTSVEGIPEAIGTDGAGILIERTPEALAKAILFYLDNPEEARKAGIIGRKRVEAMFDIKENVHRLEEIYSIS
ncbi:MAG: glycosyltransferase family 4 protein [Candidatus Omnitrophota bacterium]